MEYVMDAMVAQFRFRAGCKGMDFGCIVRRDVLPFFFYLNLFTHQQ